MMGEIVAWSLNPTKDVRRLVWSHSSWSSGDQSFACYRAEPHPSPSRDGRRLLFASNWRRYTQGQTNHAPYTWRKSYIVDTRPTPKAITDLREVLPQYVASVRLRWTAPVDDMVANAGNVASYEVRYSTSPLTAESFYDGTSVTGPTVVAAGNTQNLVVSGLTPCVEYYFAVKAVGTCGPRAGISNVLWAPALVISEGVTCE